MNTVPPLTSIYDLSDLTEAGEEIVVVANAGQRVRLAEWAGVDAVNQFEATIDLQKESATCFRYKARLLAEVVQSCVVTLEPVLSKIERPFGRKLNLVRRPIRHSKSEEVSGEAGDGPEEIESTEFDLAAPLLEEFVLAIDPYPRATGVVFESPLSEEQAVSPFAVLKGMRSAN